jgi:hypothetical protein
MFRLRKGLAWCATRLEPEAFAGFAVGSAVTLALVLTLNLLLPTNVVEKRVLEAAKQALHGTYLP